MQILDIYYANIVQTGLYNSIKDKTELSVCHPPTHLICENPLHWAAYAAKKVGVGLTHGLGQR